MWYLKKTVVISSAHMLVGYQGPCANIHGHNWTITVYCKASALNKQDMVIDFKEIKNIINGLDHKFLNDEIKLNPTAENLAKHICDKIPFCYKVRIEEQEGSECMFVKEKRTEDAKSK